MTNDIRKKLQNIDIILNEISLFPQTYNTILGNSCKDGTCQFLLRKKLNVLCKNGELYKTAIPGTRFGQTVFYKLPKKYNIVVEAGRMGSNVIVFFNFIELNKFNIKVNDYWLLEKINWKKLENKILFEGNVLKWI